MAIIPGYESAANGCVQYAEGDQSATWNVYDTQTWELVAFHVTFDDAMAMVPTPGKGYLITED